MSGTRRAPGCELLVLPEEYYCPDVEAGPAGASWQLNWATRSDLSSGRLKCKAVHGHSYEVARQRAPVMTQTNTSRGIIDYQHLHWAYRGRARTDWRKGIDEWRHREGVTRSTTTTN